MCFDCLWFFDDNGSLYLSSAYYKSVLHMFDVTFFIAPVAIKDANKFQLKLFNRQNSSNASKYGFFDFQCRYEQWYILLTAFVFMTTGERVLQRLEAAEAACSEASGSGGEVAAFHCGSPAAVRAQLTAVRSAHAHAHKLWQHKKIQLDQCFQLRLFEQDCEKMLEWIVNHRTAFLATYVEIGRSCAGAKRHQEEHARYVAINQTSLELSVGLKFRGRNMHGVCITSWILFKLQIKRPRRISCL